RAIDVGVVDGDGPFRPRPSSRLDIAERVVPGQRQAGWVETLIPVARVSGIAAAFHPDRGQQTPVFQRLDCQPACVPLGTRPGGNEPGEKPLGVSHDISLSERANRLTGQTRSEARRAPRTIADGSGCRIRILRVTKCLLPRVSRAIAL